MKVNYTKVCTLPKDLIPLLKNRGLSIIDEQKAISYLTSIGYYRLSCFVGNQARIRFCVSKSIFSSIHFRA
jgi:abortive infection bacteriophage resistance protein